MWRGLTPATRMLIIAHAKKVTVPLPDEAEEASFSSRRECFLPLVLTGLS